MNVVLFGSNNPTGAAFLNIGLNDSIEIWGRRPVRDSIGLYRHCDLSEIPSRSLMPMVGVLVSFAPIWLLAPFLFHLLKDQPGTIKNLKGIIACSSSSFMTKRFAFNRYDKELAQGLENAHHLITSICTELTIPCQILAPTMVYGEVKGYSDKNLSKIVGIMRSFPFILLPKSNGLRQPIHATQLARVAYKQSQRILTGSWSNNEPNVLILGGDSILSYESMLTKIKSEIPKNDSAKRCIILTIPEKLFFILIAVFLPVNPKLFESMMRINSNLSNFTMAHQVLEEPPIQFPVHPLATKS